MNPDIEMPTPCAICNGIDDLNDMWPSPIENDRTGSQLMCDVCHDDSEQERSQRELRETLYEEDPESNE